MRICSPTIGGSDGRREHCGCRRARHGHARPSAPNPSQTASAPRTLSEMGHRIGRGIRDPDGAAAGRNPLRIQAGRRRLQDAQVILAPARKTCSRRGSTPRPNRRRQSGRRGQVQLRVRDNRCRQGRSSRRNRRCSPPRQPRLRTRVRLRSPSSDEAFLPLRGSTRITSAPHQPERRHHGRRRCSSRRSRSDARSCRTAVDAEHLDPEVPRLANPNQAATRRDSVGEASGSLPPS